MFAHLLRRISSVPTSDYEGGFIAEVNVVRRLPPNPRLLRFIFICWVLIALKHVAVIYACHHWVVPFHQLWINAPTFALGLLATLVYWRRW